MKRCKTCGKLNWDGAIECENCHNEFELKKVSPDMDRENQKSVFPDIVAGILTLVGVILFVIDLVHLRISSISILYIAAGINIFSFRFYQEKHNQKIKLLEFDIQRLMEQVEQLHKKNAE